ncbi:MAG: two-component system response regulator [Candidatus Niyogibacteria bacterium CG10_big_fil_rev_8_21_14_0_10_46_36]|uniref:Two-component system response regulator n=1 Tax=Candidatus Niyogibacteria bacterium CG10_big_fil_rev_8_21_14_0_10_46_36 TaxID=1974726 RepID=A0A2H0TDP3_9BACT|nr:MAG: two-component system response regulator [Candidatus Niyogibacteria bacterium CG10_big_fil_rev_8_21_14_0_10_46_36]
MAHKEARMAKKDIKKILIVDDDDFLLDVYASRFREAGFEVEVAMNGEEGVEKLRNGFRPDVVSLDVIMPRKSGFEVLAQIQQEQLMRGGIIVMLSNVSDKHDIQKGKRMGAHGYFVKVSHTPSQIVDKIESLLQI